MKTNTESMGVPESNIQCAGIHELIDWQIIQYRQAVDGHRIDLSKAEGRCVAWQEAERDYTRSDRAAMGEKWRVEYCGLICPHKNNCLTALQFLRRKNIEPLYKAG